MLILGRSACRAGQASLLNPNRAAQRNPGRLASGRCARLTGYRVKGVISLRNLVHGQASRPGS
jgi:hypothetical protein